MAQYSPGAHIGDLTSNIGTAISATALAFAVLDDTARAVSASCSQLAAGILPEIAFMLAGGLFADRLGRRQAMLTADLARTASQGALAALVPLGEDRAAPGSPPAPGILGYSNDHKPAEGEGPG